MGVYRFDKAFTFHLKDEENLKNSPVQGLVNTQIPEEILIDFVGNMMKNMKHLG